jgi:O-antigen ligase
VALLSENRYKFLKLASTFAVISALFLAFTLTPNRFTVERYTGESGMRSIQYRLGWMIMSWEMVKQHPFLGVGTGNFYTDYNRYIRAAPHMVPRNAMINHNGFMQVWAENGTIGLAILLLLLLSVPLEMYKHRYRDTDDEIKALRIGIFTSFLIYVICIGVIPALENEIGWITIAFAAVLANIQESEASGLEPGRFSYAKTF